MKGIKYAVTVAPLEYRGSHTAKTITIEASHEKGIAEALTLISKTLELVK